MKSSTFFNFEKFHILAKLKLWHPQQMRNSMFAFAIITFWLLVFITLS